MGGWVIDEDWSAQKVKKDNGNIMKCLDGLGPRAGDFTA
jgi:hypothetical protein